VTGHICDLMMEDQSWAICQLVGKAGDRLSGTEVPIPASQVCWTRHAASTAFMHLTGEAAEQGSGQQLALVGTVDLLGRTAQASNKKRKNTNYMKDPNSPVVEAPQPPVFPRTFHRLRPNSETPLPGSKPQKRDDIFSKSRDLREDRGSRQMKTSHNPRTFPHGR
jgi:hypothetical protein